MSSSTEIRYHFGPRDRRGLLLGVRLGQIAILATGAFVGMVVLLGARGSARGPNRSPASAPASWWTP